MARYQVDGIVLDTDKAVQYWSEKMYWDGHNNCSKVTRSQWQHEKLYRSRKDNYYIESWSNYQGDNGGARIISDQEATKWLLMNDYPEKDIPEDLQKFIEEITE